MKGAGYIVVGVLATLCVLAPIAMAGGLGSSGLKSGGAPVNGAAITPSSVTTDALTVNGGLTVQAATPATLRNAALTKYIDLNNASGIDVSPGAGNRVRIIGGIRADDFIALGTKTSDSATAPTVVACSGTAASVTLSNGTAAVVFDVGTSCAGESTAVITLPASTSGWLCSCSSTTADRIVQQKVLPPASTTVVTMQNIVLSTGADGDFTDGADVGCICRGL